jgi:hypothetical protein
MSTVNTIVAGELACELADDLQALGETELSEKLISAVLGGATGWEIHGRLSVAMPIVRRVVFEKHKDLIGKVEKIFTNL